MVVILFYAMLPCWLMYPSRSSKLERFCFPRKAASQLFGLLHRCSARYVPVLPTLFCSRTRSNLACGVEKFLQLSAYNKYRIVEVQ